MSELATATPASSANAKRSVSVVICAYTAARRELLTTAVESLRRQAHAPEEVIVVIDHSAELTAWARSTLGDAVVIASEGPRGLSGARNTGLAAASGEIVAFLDDDAAAGPLWTERLAAAYEDPSVVAAGGSVVPDPEVETTWFPKEFGWVVGCSYAGQPTEPEPVRNLIGCNMSFRREAVLAAGGFATDVGRIGADGAGCEETDLCIRLAAEPPSAIVYDPAASVTHRVPAERLRLGYFVKRCLAEGRSKADISRRLGRNRALETERSYVRRTLPRGVASGLLAFGRGDVAGIGRAAAIVLGLAVTATGFASRAIAAGVRR